MDEKKVSPKAVVSIGLMLAVTAVSVLAITQSWLNKAEYDFNNEKTAALFESQIALLKSDLAKTTFETNQLEAKIISLETQFNQDIAAVLGAKTSEFGVVNTTPTLLIPENKKNTSIENLDLNRGTVSNPNEDNLIAN